jgi:hypothetical protein
MTILGVRQHATAPHTYLPPSLHCHFSPTLKSFACFINRPWDQPYKIRISKVLCLHRAFNVICSTVLEINIFIVTVFIYSVCTGHNAPSTVCYHLILLSHFMYVLHIIQRQIGKPLLIIALQTVSNSYLILLLSFTRLNFAMVYESQFHFHG